MAVLDEIVAGVLVDLAERQARAPLEELQRRVRALPAPRDPMPAFRAGGVALIAEVKRASPSKGALAPIADPAALAVEYEAGGAAAISVLTEARRFSGSLADLVAVRERVTIPVLRKDFIVTDYQVWESRAAGADLVLLIVAALADEDLGRLHRLATSLGMTVLVETHTVEEVARALAVGATLIGVNNRSLQTLVVDTATVAALAPLVPPHLVLVAESGILTPEDARAAAAAGADVLLVGEALVRAVSPRTGVAQMIAAASGAQVARPSQKETA